MMSAFAGTFPGVWGGDADSGDRVRASDTGCVLYIDSARWPAHGRLWAHLISDVSYAELHAFAEMLGAPRRGFERDHYDVPTELVPIAIWLGARQVQGKEIAARLRGAGLRRPKHLSRGYSRR